jgi:hypothetical protein
MVLSEEIVWSTERYQNTHDSKRLKHLIEEIESNEMLWNPELYSLLQRNNIEMAKHLKEQGYTVEQVRGIWNDFRSTLERKRNDFALAMRWPSNTRPFWYTQNIWQDISPDWNYYTEQENGYIFVHDLNFGVVNLDIRPAFIYKRIKPLYYVTLTKEFKLENSEWVGIDKLEIPVYDIAFFDEIWIEEQPVIDQVDQVATISYERWEQYYIWTQSVAPRLYFNYLFFKQENMQRWDGWAAPWPKEWARYTQLSFRSFLENIWNNHAETNYKYWLEQVKDILSQRL